MGVFTPWRLARAFSLGDPVVKHLPLQIKKMWYIYTIEYYSAMRKNEVMPFAATRMGLEMIILSEVSQKEKDKYHMTSLICGF